jgi:hypothetical protein
MNEIDELMNRYDRLTIRATILAAKNTSKSLTELIPVMKEHLDLRKVIIEKLKGDTNDTAGTIS